jgi:hypothetical protein
MKIFGLTLAFWLLLSSLSAAAPSQVQLLPFDPQALPREIRYQGKVVAGARWVDKEGENLLLLCETETVMKPVPRSSKYYGFEKWGKTAELYAYHYVKAKEKFALWWKVFDSGICPFDLELTFLPNSLTITDLDHNGIAESTFLYKKGCRSDVSPVQLKLIMHEGQAKYALRGETMVPSIKPDGTPGKIGGQKSIDPAFRRAPKVLLDYVLRQWDAFVEEKFGD